jgi:hypothetical protein
MSVTTGTDAASMLNRILVEGMKPNPWELHELGLDIKYLEKIVDKVKGRLWELPDYRPLKDAINSGKSQETQRLFTEASHADVRCLRLSWVRESFTGSPNYDPLLTLYPKDDQSMYAKGRKSIDLFVTCRGEWILYDGLELTDESSFTICRTVDELSAHLDELEGDMYKLGPSKEQILITIAKKLMNTLREDGIKARQRAAYIEATVAECEMLEGRMGYK